MPLSTKQKVAIGIGATIGGLAAIEGIGKTVMLAKIGGKYGPRIVNGGRLTGMEMMLGGVGSYGRGMDNAVRSVNDTLRMYQGLGYPIH